MSTRGMEPPTKRNPGKINEMALEDIEAQMEEIDKEIAEIESLEAELQVGESISSDGGDAQGNETKKMLDESIDESEGENLKN